MSERSTLAVCQSAVDHIERVESILRDAKFTSAGDMHTAALTGLARDVLTLVERHGFNTIMGRGHDLKVIDPVTFMTTPRPTEVSA